MTGPLKAGLPFTVTVTGLEKSTASGDSSSVKAATSRTFAANALPVRVTSTRPDSLVCWKKPRSFSSVSREASWRSSLMTSQRLRLNLSVRSVSSNTCPIDGWLGLSAGGRAAAPRSGEAANPAKRPCPQPPTVADGSVQGWSDYLAAAADEKFDTQLGLLAEVADQGGLCVRTVQPYAAVGGALPDGTVERYGPWTSDTLLEDLNACPVTLVDVGALRDPDDVAPGEAPSGSREQQLSEIGRASCRERVSSPV